MIAPMYMRISGKTVDVLDLKPDDIWIEDIALGLSRINRYLGQTKFPYSVAQHSVLLSRIVPEHLRKVALLHDAPEYVIGDMISPLKVQDQLFNGWDHQITQIIFDKFGVDANLCVDLHPYDKSMYIEEHDQLHLNQHKHEHRFHIFKKTSAEAFQEFMKEWENVG